MTVYSFEFEEKKAAGPRRLQRIQYGSVVVDVPEEYFVSSAFEIVAAESDFFCKVEKGLSRYNVRELFKDVQDMPHTVFLPRILDAGVKQLQKFASKVHLEVETMASARSTGTTEGGTKRTLDTARAARNAELVEKARAARAKQPAKRRLSRVAFDS